MLLNAFFIVQQKLCLYAGSGYLFRLLLQSVLITLSPTHVYLSYCNIVCPLERTHVYLMNCLYLKRMHVIQSQSPVSYYGTRYNIIIID